MLEEAYPYFCMDLTYVHTLLLEGFRVPETTDITIVKKVGVAGGGPQAGLGMEVLVLGSTQGVVVSHAHAACLQVQYKEEQIEAAWPLGAAINTLK